MRRKTADTPVKTKCLACGKKVSETLGRFAKKPEPVCPSCGGNLDIEPLRKLTVKTAKDFKAALEVDMKISNIKYK